MYGLLGHNINYTFSPLIHSRLGYDYAVFDLNQNDFEEFMQKKEFLGINVTIPYKQAVIPYLDEIHDSAASLGVVNTIVNKNGYLIGYNTDTKGFDYALVSNQVKIANKKVLILGTGATAQSIKSVIHKYKPDDIKVIGRNTDINYSNLGRVRDYNIIINTSPIGVYPNIEDSLVEPSDFLELETLIDVIYNPLNTNLISKAKALNKLAYGGLLMLVAQAVFAYEYFFDQKMPLEIIDDIYKDIVKSKENIVLIGMPTSGKSTLAKALGQALNRVVYDVDQEIVKRSGLSIVEIFNQYGEDYFRKLESEIILDLSKLQSVIIATGGGSILKVENRLNLRLNGKLILLDRSLKNLKSSNDRPLNSSAEQLEKQYLERKDLYVNSADLIVDNNGEIASTLERILDLVK